MEPSGKRTPWRFQSRIDLDTLPSMIAIPLSEIESETHPIVQLWRISDTAELTLRLIVAIAAAELEVAEGKIPDAVATRLLSLINLPTLGNWLEMAEQLTNALDEKLGERAIVPELSHSVQQVLKPLLKSGPGTGEKKASKEPSLNTLRNLLAHGAGFGTAIAERMLPTQLSRLLDAIEKLGWLHEIRLVSSCEDQRLAVLSGVRPTIDKSGAIPISSFIGSTGEVSLIRGFSVLPLWPLHAYLPPEVFRPRYDKTGAVSKPVPLVYYRRNGSHLQMTPLGSDFPDGELRGTASARFEKLFRLNDQTTLLGNRISNFETESDGEAKSFVGRTDAIKSIRDTIKNVGQGVIWLHGLAGTGKSALMAKMANYYKTTQKPGPHLISFRFPAGDQRSTRDKFLRHAISRLESILDPNKLELRDDRDRLERRLAELLGLINPPMRVVVLLDGLDEIGRIDPEFLELPFRFRHEGLARFRRPMLILITAPHGQHCWPLTGAIE